MSLLRALLNLLVVGSVMLSLTVAGQGLEPEPVQTSEVLEMADVQGEPATTITQEDADAESAESVTTVAEAGIPTGQEATVLENAEKAAEESIKVSEEDAITSLDNAGAVKDENLSAELPNGEISTLREGEAGTGRIRGEVFEGSSGKGISGVIVEIAHLGLSVRTSSEGKYELLGVGLGNHSVSFTKSGYIFEERTVELLSVASPIILNMGMELRPVETAEETYMMEEYEVVEDYTDDDDQFELTLDRTAAPSFTSGIGAADFSKAGVSDAAGALTKVVGANIADGKFAVVRGLSDQYVTTTVGNSVVASASTIRKAVELDLFPTDVINKIDVRKTYDVSMPGEFGGGGINIEFAKFPNERMFEISYGVGWNSNLENPFRRYGNELDFWGDHANLLSDEVYWSDGDIRNGGELSAEATEERLTSQESYFGVEDDPNPSQSFSLTVGDAYEVVEGVTLGFLYNFSYSTQDSINAYEVAESAISVNERIVTFSDRSQWESTLDWSNFFTAGINIHDKHRIDGAYFQKRIVRDFVQLEDNINDGYRADTGKGWGSFGLPATSTAEFGVPAFLTGQQWNSGRVVREFELMQLSGSHAFGDEENIRFSWGWTDTESYITMPQFTRLETTELSFDYGLEEVYANDVGQMADLIGLDVPEDLYVAEATRYFLLPQLDSILEEGVALLNATQESVDLLAETAPGTPEYATIVESFIPAVLEDLDTTYQEGIANFIEKQSPLSINVLMRDTVYQRDIFNVAVVQDMEGNYVFDETYRNDPASDDYNPDLPILTDTMATSRFYSLARNRALNLGDFTSAEERFDSAVQDLASNGPQEELDSLLLFFSEESIADAEEQVAAANALGLEGIYTVNPFYYGNPDAGDLVRDLFVASQTYNQSTDFFGDFEVDLPFGNDEERLRKATLRSGYRYSRKQREAIGQGYWFAIGANESDSIDGLQFTDADLNATSSNIGADLLSSNVFTQEDTETSLQLQYRSNYDADVEVTGGYIAGDFGWDDWLKGTVGYRLESEKVKAGKTIVNPSATGQTVERSSTFRVEASDSTLSLADFFALENYESVTRDDTFHLFSGNLQGTFLDGDLRLGGFFAQTTARPSIRQYQQFLQYIPEENIVFQGSAFAKTTHISNLDYTLEWDMTDNFNISVARFYKDIKDATVSFLAGSEDGLTSIETVNPQNASNSLWLERGLDPNRFLTGVINGWEVTADWKINDYWSLSGNATYVDRAELNYFDSNESTAETINITTRYPDQPKNIYNLNLGYTNDDWGVTANFIYNYTGESLRYLPKSLSAGDPAIYTLGRSQLDFNIAKSFSFDEFDLVLQFKMGNILDEDVVRVERGEAASQIPTRITQRGRNYGVEVKLSF